MSSAKITLIGFYNYFNEIGKNLFSEMVLPDGIDKDTLINTILMEGGEFESLYGNPEYIQGLIGVWSNKWNRTFTKWVEGLAVEYNPLDNYDRIESWTDNTTSTGSLNSSNNSSDNSFKSAYDSYTMSPYGQNTSSNTTGSTTSSDTGVTHSGRIRGNIGVTTSSTMLKEFIDTQKEYGSIYNMIADIFIEEFCLLVY